MNIRGPRFLLLPRSERVIYVHVAPGVSKEKGGEKTKGFSRRLLLFCSQKAMRISRYRVEIYSGAHDSQAKSKDTSRRLPRGATPVTQIILLHVT